jgi:shikimate kinase
MHLSLTGFMGCGKSTVGKHLQQWLPWPLYDTDAVIESLTGNSIRAFFAAEGEAHFRRFEYRIITELLQSEENSLIVCGGGTPCFFDTMDVLNRQSFTIYLQASPETLYRRLRRSAEERPLLPPVGDLRKFIENLLAQRETVYQQAQLTVCVDEKPAEEVARELQAKLHGVIGCFRR